MLTLAIDTSATLCAAALHESASGRILAARTEDIGRGHAERLMAMIEAVLEEAGTNVRDIGRVAVTTGPGSFTGIRVGVAAARGLALALRIEAIGVTTLEAIGRPAAEAAGAAVLAAIDARRGEVYAQAFDAHGQPVCEPRILAPERAAHLAASHDILHLAGSGAHLVAEAARAPGLPTEGDGDGRGGALVIVGPATVAIEAVARIGAAAAPGTAQAAGAPKPLYLRGADAAPQADKALPRRPEAVADDPVSPPASRP